jgi:anti-sigma regulatory factor (Ser/Thr protein kinase)
MATASTNGSACTSSSPRCRATGGPGLSVRVRDEGCGFDPAILPDPLAPENLLKANGRGIFLMRSFMDEMTFNRVQDGGMEVRMVKRVAQSTIA